MCAIVPIVSIRQWDRNSTFRGRFAIFFRWKLLSIAGDPFDAIGFPKLWTRLVIWVRGALLLAHRHSAVAPTITNIAVYNATVASAAWIAPARVRVRTRMIRWHNRNVL